MVAAVLAVAALTLPGTFREVKQLEPAASYVAGKPVRVYCARTDLDLRTYVQQRYGGGLTYDGGLALIPDGVAILGQSVCDPLLAEMKARRVMLNADFSDALVVLVHEGVHLRGITDEGATQCEAMHLTPRVAVKFFRVKAGKQLRGVMSDVWAAYSALPASYQTVCGSA